MANFTCMKDKDGIITVTSQYIERGIKKYEGVIDIHLQALIQKAKLSYTPYRFNDGRVLLVLPENSCAFLYPSLDILYASLDLRG